MTPEAKVKKAIVAYLKSIGAYYVMPIGSPYGAASLDIFICYQGRFYGVEVKRPGGKPTARQACIMAEVAKAGGGICCATSVDDVRSLLCPTP